MTTVLNINPKIGEPETGIDNISGVAHELYASLSDTYVLLTKSQACHWNATGPVFHSIHVLTEEHYNNLFAAIDVMAERVRSLGKTAPVSMSEIIGHANLDEWQSAKDTGEMISSLIADHEICAMKMRDLIEKAETGKDHVTADMLTERIAFHEKAIWMLKALSAK